MKKIITLLIVSSIIVNNMFNLNVNAYSKNEYINKANTVQDSLKNKKNWEKYSKAIDKFIKNNKNNEKKLNQLNVKLKKILNGWKIKNKTTIDILTYFQYKTEIELINIEKKDIIIKKWFKVNVHYEWKLEDWEIFDSSYERLSTLDFTIGEWEMIPWFENAVKWMKIWEVKTVSILPKDAYWEIDENNFQVVSKDELKSFTDAGIELKVWNLIPTYYWNYKITEVTEDTVTIDMNHQFAWKTLIFKIEIIDFKKIKNEDWSSSITQKQLNSIKDNSYISWNKDADITIIEYSDMECPFCAKLHNQWTLTEIEKKYTDDVNYIFNHYPLSFHDNAFKASEISECLAEQKWSDSFYKLIDKSFSEWNSDETFLIKESISLGADEELLNKCLDTNKYKDKINHQMNTGSELFEISGTPWTIIINNKSLNYKIINWAYPTQNFLDTIEELK